MEKHFGKLAASTAGEKQARIGGLGVAAAAARADVCFVTVPYAAQAGPLEAPHLEKAELEVRPAALRAHGQQHPLIRLLCILMPSDDFAKLGIDPPSLNIDPGSVLASIGEPVASDADQTASRGRRSSWMNPGAPAAASSRTDRQRTCGSWRWCSRELLMIVGYRRGSARPGRRPSISSMRAATSISRASRARPCFSIVSEPSTPTTRQAGKARANRIATSPGPQPRSRTSP